MLINLNYPAFFYAAIKDNTTLDQYEVFNILFKGDTYKNNGCNAISQSSSSNFSVGRRKITQDLLLEIFNTPHETLTKRIQMLQLKDADLAARTLNRILITSDLYAADNNKHLLSLPDAGQVYGYLADFFLYSLKYTDTTHLLTDREKRILDSCRFPEPNQITEETSTASAGATHRDGMSRYIPPHVARDQFLNYCILEECSPNDKVKLKPVGFWRIRLLAFLIRDSSGKRFLPLQLQHYGGIWTVPHVAKKLDLHSRVRTMGTLASEIKEYSSQFDALFDEFEEQQFYQMGLFSSKSKHIRSYVEYKTSVGLAGIFQCYLVEEREVSIMDGDEIINISDPENYKGFRYLPIGDDGRIYMGSPYVRAASDGRGVWFFDHLLSTNIINLIEYMNGFRNCTYDLPEGCVMSEVGVVIKPS